MSYDGEFHDYPAVILKRIRYLSTKKIKIDYNNKMNVDL